MRHIKKGTEPSSWLQFRKQRVTDPRFDDGPKDDLRSALLAEQGHLCCYCMGRIASGTMKIEHWAPRSVFPERALDFSNLLAACDGGEGLRAEQGRRRASEHHCDTAKGSESITLDPRRKECERLIAYTAKGELIPAKGAAAFVQEDIDVLRLNLPRFTGGRQAAMDELRKWASSKDTTRSRGQLEQKRREIETPNEKGQLPSFVGAAVYWLHKHARSRPK